ncbi:ribonuclease III [Anaerosinus massiliensis]|uniref:ribonuclease III n=1 Tax=Massilibacillus massiliensis TaxID=1806837 RepID=UPI000ACA4F64|nr:ribonuclease III [Massilibacillus massiliensis]
MSLQKRLGKDREVDLIEVSKGLGVSFTNLNLLHQALTHTSYANEAKKAHILHNERLEFLGDAVLELVISNYLFRHFMELPEGELTKARAAIVCEATLAKRAASLNVGRYLLFGKGELATGGRERTSILADAFEAIIGAIYLDHGIDAVTNFILAQLHDDLLSIKNGSYIKDYKTLLQEVIQKNSDNKISYEIISESGPDHNKVFHIAVLINDERLGSGFGKSKKEAEQSAAKQALMKMNKLNS